MSTLAVGIDVGGTKIAAGVVNRAGRIRSRVELRTHAGRPPAEVVDAIAETHRAALARAGQPAGEALGVGLGFGGHVNGPAGLVLTSSNLPDWDRVPLRDVVAERLGARVVLENDSNCAALAEHRFGAGRGSRHMCYVTISTGFGLGIIVDGRLYVGATGTAGEIGHTVVDPNGPPCTCGKRGCIMAYSCGMALSRMARERILKGEPTSLREAYGDSPERVDCEAIAAAARRGDPLAGELIGIAGRYFGIGLSTIVQVINPEVIVVGGGLARIGPLLLEPCLAALREHVHPVLADSARIVMSELWDDAGLIGAAALCWE